jgi:predicted NBD/HSP70 family sugar kinase
VATPQSIRYLNEVQALNALFRGGGMSRADLARRLRLNRASVGYIIRDLLEAGLVRERAALEHPGAKARAGRPGIVVELDPDGAASVGVEIGVDHITVVVVDLGGREFLRRSIEYATSSRPPEVAIHRAAALVNAISGSLGGRRSRIRGVCVAVPALVRGGVVVNGLMLGWRNVPLREIMQGALEQRLPVMVENDANALAIGVTYGVASKPSDAVVCLNIENGAGGGIVIGGELYRGATGFAGEFGQLRLGGEGFCTGLFRPGRLESYVGKDAVLARYRANGGPAVQGLPQLFAALNEGDRIALRTADDWGDRLAQGLVHVVDVVNPGRIVLGGSVAPLFAHVADRVQAAMRKEFLEGFPLPPITISRLGPGGTALGAACLIHQSMFSVDERMVHAQAEPSARRATTNSKRRAASSTPRREERRGRALRNA